MEKEVQVTTLAMSKAHGNRGAAAKVELLWKVWGERQPSIGGVRRQDATNAIGQLRR
ncbi:MAG TPA: hypothetical protein VNM89_06520 [Solirubrobacterales bacterium]|nr:hypothetical protein [Solirubrobacterales bacterium]